MRNLNSFNYSERIILANIIYEIKQCNAQRELQENLQLFISCSRLLCVSHRFGMNHTKDSAGFLIITEERKERSSSDRMQSRKECHVCQCLVSRADRVGATYLNPKRDPLNTSQRLAILKVIDKRALCTRYPRLTNLINR